MDCARCKSTIEDDSFYCDQCGTELLRCAACGRLGDKQRCIYCGKPLVAIRTAGVGNAASGGAPAAGNVGACAAGVGAGADSVGASDGTSAVTPNTGARPAAPTVGHLRLSNSRHGIDISPADGDVLGRRFGAHVSVLSRFSQISSSHLQVKRAADGSWRVIDLNSFNSTFYNGVRLAPQQEHPIAGGGILALGDIEFRITLS